MKNISVLDIKKDTSGSYANIWVAQIECGKTLYGDLKNDAIIDTKLFVNKSEALEWLECEVTKDFANQYEYFKADESELPMLTPDKFRELAIKYGSPLSLVWAIQSYDDYEFKADYIETCKNVKQDTADLLGEYYHFFNNYAYSLSKEPLWISHKS